jgi:flagellar hook assembly protein FlgD
VNLHIYDAAGRLVRVIVNESREAAWYEEIWDGTDSEDRKVASGVYFFRLSSGKFVQTRKMVLLR